MSSSQVERGTVREMVHTIAFRAGVLERILQEPVLGGLEIRANELAHVQLLQRQIDDLRRYLNLPSAEPEPEEFEWCHDCKEYDQKQHCCHRWTKVIRQTVEEMKSAEPERKTGKWIYDTERVRNDGGVYAQYHCSECHYQIFGGLSNYCPNCGAYMRGE